MRVVFSMLSLLFVGIVGCGTAGDSPSEAASIGSIASADGQRTVCPDICGLGTQCQFPDGSCTRVPRTMVMKVGVRSAGGVVPRHPEA
jgi:hypothetical protein